MERIEKVIFNFNLEKGHTFLLRLMTSAFASLKTLSFSKLSRSLEAFALSNWSFSSCISLRHRDFSVASDVACKLS